MVGRSKPQKKMEPRPSMDFYSAEIAFLKKKNQELAKALADSKTAFTQMVEERDMIQRELFATNLRYTKLENYVKSIDSAARACINSIVISSNHVTEILQATSNAVLLNRGDDFGPRSFTPNLSLSAHSSPALSNKTQAVKPMIGGHVILRPTINLRRVNEIPIEEIQRLQSDSTVTNLNAAGTNISAAGGEQNQDNHPVRTFRDPQQLVDSVAESLDNNNAEDEYTDHTSDLSDDLPLPGNNGLDTVQEEEEDQLEHSLSSEHRRTSITNSNTSLGIAGNSSQIPLLSGVFRDVRVYLSPMQNVGQYLDPRQHVTAERGSNKTHKVQRSHSAHSAKSSDNLPHNSRGTSTENKSPMANLNLNGSPAMQANTSTASSSLEESFTASMQNSLLSSTKIGTPRPAHTTLSKPEDLNWIEVGNFNSSMSSQSAFSKNSRCSLGDVTNTEITSSVRERLSDNNFVPKTSDFSKRFSSSKCGQSSTDYDPLEGPSTMLDCCSAETRNKIETLGILGLTPTFTQRNKSTPDSPSSPARTVLQRRERRISDENAKKAGNVTKRRSIEKKKATVLSTKVAKVIVRRLSLSKTQASTSPPKRKSLDTPQKENDPRSPQRRLVFENTPTRESASSHMERGSGGSSQDLANTSISSTSSASGILSMEKPALKKRGRKSKQELSVSQESKKSVTPTSPQKRGRPRRAMAPPSFKEPSLRKKLRRSK